MRMQEFFFCFPESEHRNRDSDSRVQAKMWIAIAVFVCLKIRLNVFGEENEVRLKFVQNFVQERRTEESKRTRAWRDLRTFGQSRVKLKRVKLHEIG